MLSHQSNVTSTFFFSRTGLSLLTVVLLSAAARAQTSNLLVVPPNYPAGSNPYSVVLADFNGDGIMDAAVTNAPPGGSGAGAVSILLGNGDGTFKTPVSYATDSGSQSVAVADFNGDGKLDLVVANPGSSSTPAGINVFFGNGDGTFQAAANYTNGAAPISLAVGDFNGDGKPDVVVVNSFANYVTILLNQGNGTFKLNNNVTLPSSPSSVAVGDVNRDGKLDLVLSGGSNGNTFFSGFAVLLGNGDGTFQTPKIFGVGEGATITLSDLNGDGKLDIVAAYSNAVEVLLGNGDATFQTPTDYNIAGGSFVSVGDFNGDGKPDLVVSCPPNVTAVMIGHGDGTFLAPLTYAGGGVTSAVGDLNGDGKLDFVSTGAGGLQVFLGKGDGTFPAPVTYQPNIQPFSVAVSDLNGDGKLDYVTANFSADTLSVFLGNGDGTFPATPVTYPTGSPASVRTGDLNGDGIPDLVVANENESTVSIFLGNGDGTFQPGVPYATSASPTSVAVGDFNGDGIGDVAVANQSGGGLSILLGNGDGTFGPASILSLGGQMNAIVAGDFNGDGKLDLALCNTGGTIDVLLGNGDGTFEQAATHAVANNPSSLAAADLNGDGKLDLLVASGSGVAILLNNGDGTFQPAVTYAAGNAASSVVVSDFNGDGVPDVAVLSSAGEILYFLMGNGDGTFQAPQNQYAAAGNVLASGDFRDAGVTDLIVGGNGASVYLNAHAQVAGLSTKALTFGGQVVGSSSAPQTVTLTNTGSGPFTATGISSTPDFSVSGSCTSVAADGTCSLSVEFHPLAPLTRKGSLTIGESNLAGSQSVALSGIGIGPIAVLGTTSLNFPRGTVGTASAAIQVTLTNAGNAALEIDSVSTSGDFAETNTCGTSLAAGASCTISVTFTPTVAGSRSGVLTITDNSNGNAGSTQTVTLAGTATGAPLTASPTSLTFANVPYGTASAPETVTVTNTGVTPLAVIGITVTGDFGQTNTCSSAPIPGNGTCTISVTYTPSGGTSGNGTLTIQSYASNSPNVVTLSGTEAAAGIGLNALQLYFNNDLVGVPSAPASLNVMNVGNLPLAITSITPSSQFSQTNTCTAALAPLASCTVNVTFTPAAAGQVTGTLAFVSNAPYSPVVDLYGTGTTSYSTPYVYQLTPPEAMARSSQLMLTVAGNEFGPQSIVNWNSKPQATTFVNGGQLTASILASELATPGTPLVTVVNPTPGGTSQNSVGFDVINPKRTLSFVQTDFSVGTEPVSMSMADLNGDGKEDLVVANYSDGTVSVLLGNGDGTFKPQVTYPIGAGMTANLTPVAMVVGDFNGDGKLDIAVANAGCPPSGGTCSGGSIVVLPGNGDGTFGQPISTGAPDFVLNTLATGDFNGDGRRDLAVGAFGDEGGAVIIYLGNGDGTFQASATYSLGGQFSEPPESIAVADFNGDGKLDLASANGYGATNISILLGNGNGSFASPVQYVTGLSPAAIALADFNADGKLDLVVANSDPSANTVSILLGNGDGSFKTHVDYRTGVGGDSVAVGDFNGDKKLDLAVADNYSETVSILPGNGDGTFQTNMDFPVGGYADAIVARDFNGDGRLDLAVTNGVSNSVSVLLQAGPEASLTPSTLTFAGQLVGSTSSAQTVSLANSGISAMTLTGIAASGDFAQTNTCGTSLAPGANCTISVTFKSTASGARAGALTITDNAPGSPHTVDLTGTGQDFSLGTASGSSSTATVTPGQTATYTLALGGLGGLSQSVSFSCSGAPSETTCTVNPSAAAPSASGSVSIAVTLATTAPSLVARRNRRVPPQPFPGRPTFREMGRTFAILLLAFLAWLSLAPARASLEMPWQVGRRVAIAALALLTLLFVACGGGGRGGGGGPTNSGTPAGNYTISVTGSISGSTTLQHSTTLTLNVT